MDKMFSSIYKADNYIPVSTEVNSRNDFRRTDDHHRNRNSPNQAANSTRFHNNMSEDCHIPWKNRESYSCGVIGLHEEINDFYDKLRPTEQEEEVRLRVVEHITKVAHSLWPLAKVEVFGSFRTGLYLPSSDIDMVIQGEWRSLPLSTLSEALQKNGILESDINIIANASVPIVRLLHTPSRIRVDISFNLTNGVQGAKLIKKLMKQYPALPKLVVVLKQFLIQRGLNEVYNGGMSSYTLTLLIVSLLQGYHKPKTEPSTNLGTLLIEFFEHYGVNFNYERVSIHFQNEFTGGMYQPKFKCDGLLSVEDPLQKGRDIAKGTFLVHALRMAFENAFYVLHKAVTDSAAWKRPLNSYLSLIVRIDEKLWEEREWMTRNHSVILRKLSELSPSSIQTDRPSNSSTDSQNTKKKQHR